MRNVRRSMVFARPACNPLARRGSAAAPADFLVSSMAASSDLRGAVVVAYVLAGLVAARRTFVLFQHPRTGFLGHDGGRGRRAAGAHGQQEIAPGEAPGALGHDCLLDLLVLAAKYAPILEHFKCGKLKLEEAFCEAGDRVGAGRRAGEFAPRGRDAALLRIDRVRPGDRLQERRVRGRIEQPRQQPVEVGPGRLLRVHFLKSKIVASERFSIMSTTRQSPHICRRRRAPSPANIEWPPSLPSMLSTIRRVPNGLPQRTQWNGSASFSVTACFAWGPNRSRGTSSIASSGQVSAHRPHCTQLRSMKRSRGASAASSRAPSGHAPMQALHSVQVCLLTARAPNGAPAGSLISSIFLGAFTAR